MSGSSIPHNSTLDPLGKWGGALQGRNCSGLNHVGPRLCFFCILLTSIGGLLCDACIDLRSEVWALSPFEGP